LLKDKLHSITLPIASDSPFSFLKKPNPLDQSEIEVDVQPAYMVPVLENDSLLFSLPSDDTDEDLSSSSASISISNPSTSSHQWVDEKKTLLDQIAHLSQSLEQMTSFVHSQLLEQPSMDSDLPPMESSTPVPASTPAVVPEKPKKDPDSGYFYGYSQRYIHEVMLKDTHRTESYRDAIFGEFKPLVSIPEPTAESERLFKDKIVMDVGCGTGILSLFAAKSGAKRVIGVDAAEIAYKAREIVRVNGFSDRIDIIHGKIEEISLPPGIDKVDMIVSEWMGYFLLYESMLPSVIFARNKWLRSPPKAEQTREEATGVYPDIASMFISGICEPSTDNENSLLNPDSSEAFWSNVYGFNMRPMLNSKENGEYGSYFEKDARFRGYQVETIRPAQVMTSTFKFIEFDCNYVESKDLDFDRTFELVAGNQTGKGTSISAFMVHFDTSFVLHLKNPVVLTTQPVDETPIKNPSKRVCPRARNARHGAKSHSDQFLACDCECECCLPKTEDLTTHWKQACFYLGSPITVLPGDVIKGRIVGVRKSDYHRAYTVDFHFQHLKKKSDNTFEETPSVFQSFIVD
jgi:SAM-dependent methyltransferase